jgi:EAL domain-containing protein (putative c-di-GMP-specific phosphodiesterase class I)
VLARLPRLSMRLAVAPTGELSRSLGLELIAEGIELPEEHRRLQALGCDLGQGFYLSRPVDAAAVPELLRGYAASARAPAAVRRA